MIDLERTNDIIRVEFRELPKEKLRQELLEILVAARNEEESEIAAQTEYKELLQSDEIRLAKDELYQSVERLRKLRYWARVLSNEVYPDVPTAEEISKFKPKAQKAKKED